MVNIKSDSRKVKEGDIFIALRGISSDGHDYIPQAIKNGAKKLIVEDDKDYGIETEVVSDTREYLNNYLHENYHDIIEQMVLIGMTGTNGKTTSCFLTYEALNKLGYKCGYIGTVGYYLDESRGEFMNEGVNNNYNNAPNYNYENYIEARIDSILKQTYPIYELIVLDDEPKLGFSVIQQNISSKNRQPRKFLKNIMRHIRKLIKVLRRLNTPKPWTVGRKLRKNMLKRLKPLLVNMRH